jgi:hypothetical protein
MPLPLEGRLAPRRPGPPDFIGVGAQGSGGEWWHQLLLEHPAIRLARGRRKRLHFFDEFCGREMVDADIARYHARFARRPGTITGEWTPRYMWDPWTPVLLRRCAPDAKLLVMLSDPIERYRARLARERGRVDSEDQRLFMAHAAGRGRYASQLERLTRFYDRAQILVLQAERCRMDPVTEYRRTLQFLAVQDDFVPRRLRRRADGRALPIHIRALRAAGVIQGARMLRRLTHRTAGQPTADPWPDLDDALHADLDPEIAVLQSMVPDLDLTLWPNFAHLAESCRQARSP